MTDVSQKLAELRDAINYHQAASGMVVVLDVKRSKVLGMVNFPVYNPNDRASLAARNSLAHSQAPAGIPACS